MIGNEQNNVWWVGIGNVNSDRQTNRQMHCARGCQLVQVTK